VVVHISSSPARATSARTRPEVRDAAYGTADIEAAAPLSSSLSWTRARRPAIESDERGAMAPPGHRPHAASSPPCARFACYRATPSISGPKHRATTHGNSRTGEEIPRRGEIGSR